MTKTQENKVAKKKKKTPKKIRTGFLEWLPMGIFLFFIVVTITDGSLAGNHSASNY